MKEKSVYKVIGQNAMAANLKFIIDLNIAIRFLCSMPFVCSYKLFISNKTYFSFNSVYLGVYFGAP